MIDVTLLGVGGSFPIPNRHLSALFLSYKGHGILLDCGEGTQVAMRSFHLKFKSVDLICLTHFHADHVMGLPGLLLTIGNSGRVDPITIIGPKGVKEIVESLCVVAPITYPIKFIELEKNREENIYRVEEITIDAQWVEHRMPCFSYLARLNRAGKFQAEKAKALGVPTNQWSFLQKGEKVLIDGREITPSEVLGEERKGLSVCFATDLRPSENVVDFAKEVDLFVCESNFGNPEDQSKAIEKMHCTFEESATMARKANVKELWLTHYSTALTEPELYLPLAEKIFPNTKVNQTQKTLVFEED